MSVWISLKCEPKDASDISQFGFRYLLDTIKYLAIIWTKGDQVWHH